MSRRPSDLNDLLVAVALLVLMGGFGCVLFLAIVGRQRTDSVESRLRKIEETQARHEVEIDQIQDVGCDMERRIVDLERERR